jgi:cell division protease FtsH
MPLILTSSGLKGRYFDTGLQTEWDFEGIIPHGSLQALADILVAQGFIVKIEDEHQLSRTYLLMARRCAEEIFLDSTTSAVANDLSAATELARRMVCEWGMAEELGPPSLGGQEETVFLGKEITRYRQYSEATSARIDNALRRIVLQVYRKARNILEAGHSTVVRLANALKEYETLDSRQLETLIRSESPCGSGEIRD